MRQVPGPLGDVGEDRALGVETPKRSATQDSREVAPSSRKISCRYASPSFSTMHPSTESRIRNRSSRFASRNRSQSASWESPATPPAPSADADGVVVWAIAREDAALGGAAASGTREERSCRVPSSAKDCGPQPQRALCDPGSEAVRIDAGNRHQGPGSVSRDIGSRRRRALPHDLGAGPDVVG